MKWILHSWSYSKLAKSKTQTQKEECKKQKRKHSYRLPVQYLFLDAQLPSRQINLICLGVCANYIKYKGPNQKKTVIFFLGLIIWNPKKHSHCVTLPWLYALNMFVVFGSPNPSLLVSLKNPWDLFRDIETSKRRPLTSAFDIFFLCD